jgi:hypothetical protein
MQGKIGFYCEYCGEYKTSYRFYWNNNHMVKMCDMCYKNEKEIEEKLRINKIYDMYTEGNNNE